MDVAVVIFLTLSSICTLLVALYSIYYVFVERDRRRFHYKIAFSSLLLLILTMTIRRWILEIHGQTMDNFQAYLLVYIDHLLGCIANILIILSAVASGLPIWISIMKSFMLSGSNGAGLLWHMVIFAETNGQKAIYILMILATAIFLSSAALFPRLILADILLIYSFMAIMPIITIPLFPTTYYLLVLLIKNRKEPKTSKSEMSQAKNEATKLVVIFVAKVAALVLWALMSGLAYILKPFEDNSDAWYSESNSNPCELFSAAFDWIVTVGGFLACFIFRDLPWNWLKQMRPILNTATMGTNTRDFLSMTKQSY